MTLDNQYNVAYADEYTQLLTDLHNQYCRDQPEDILQYCANFFNRKLEEQRTAMRDQRPTFFDAQEFHPLVDNQAPSTYAADLMDSDDNDIEESDFDDEERDNFSTAPLSMGPPASYNRDRRTSVSAESMAPTNGKDYIKTVIPKAQDQCDRIRVSVSNNFLFRNLDEDQHQDVVNAMAEKRVCVDEVVIEQGAVGDYFYVVESGTLDCFITKGDDPRIKVANYEAGGSFGELALMYNAPRAATIIATSDCVLWALDRVTFRTILMENTSRKRRMYEAFLEEVPLLKSLEPYERHKIADALESVYFEDGQSVVMQGDIGDQFYIIESGEASVIKDQQKVNHLERGSYFGELALLNDSPRAATVIAHGRLRCATLGKKAFTRLLGPILDILKRNSENYHAIINQQQQQEQLSAA
ncbi:camp-dependent protein kinase regulatory subunit [Radiomyces spectabilis]|uniref:camp-dependent protein kinase regulatory subunit n=1 Tax=Radiomyces spectabilis TaxID=64574 RepID=UPI00221FA8E2|nr:camp-dependent protein kinase regulatory subunit [Radiomyces spectabilis]KAI8377997.1 camp-dependent protein kinase regulatory subunit [Radiomyces spectabilis]